MTAKVNILTGVSAGASVWLEQPVIRVGSHPDVDLCLPSPELEEHVATVEYRDGSYYVYNRSSVALRIDGQEVVPEGIAVWHDGGEVELSDQTVLQLELGDDGKPTPRAIERDYLDYDEPYSEVADSVDNEDQGDEPPAETESSKDSSLKVLGQLAVILFCFLGMGVIIYTQFVNPGEPSDRQGTASDVRELIDDLSDAIATADSGDKVRQLENLRQSLRQAELSRLRGDSENTRRLYESLRSQLLHRRDVMQESRTEVETELLAYVLYRLS